MPEWTVPGYTQLKDLGSGGFGRVVLARHHAAGVLVAIKYLRADLLGDAMFTEMFRGEATALASIEDPNVVRLYEYVESPDGAAIVMELVEGVSLREILAHQGATTAEAALIVLQGSLLGLAAAHQRGVVHRDYKPENVLVDGEGASKLTDFGLAARTGDLPIPAGMLRYVAPEQIAGAPASPAGDVYAATATFYECLTGHPPFSGEPDDLLRQHNTEPVPLEPLPEPLRPLVATGMAKDPESRPADAASLVTELKAIASRAYGQDWERRGRSHLGEAALLLAALWPIGAPAAQQGTAVDRVQLHQQPRPRPRLHPRPLLHLRPMPPAIAITPAPAAAPAPAPAPAPDAGRHRDRRRDRGRRGGHGPGRSRLEQPGHPKRNRDAATSRGAAGLAPADAIRIADAIAERAGRSRPEHPGQPFLGVCTAERRRLCEVPGRHGRQCHDQRPGDERDQRRGRRAVRAAVPLQQPAQPGLLGRPQPIGFDRAVLVPGDTDAGHPLHGRGAPEQHRGHPAHDRGRRHHLRDHGPAQFDDGPYLYRRAVPRHGNGHCSGPSLGAEHSDDCAAGIHVLRHRLLVVRRRTRGAADGAAGSRGPRRQHPAADLRRRVPVPPDVLVPEQQ